MDLRALRYFRTVAACGSFSRGSALLHISQPAVSRTIRELEDELGRPLFLRSRQGASLTEAGRILFERSGQLLQQVEQASAEVRAGLMTLSGQLTIGMTPGVGHALAPVLLARFSHEHPQVGIKIIGGFSSHLHELLVRRQIDLAFTHDPLPQRGLEMRPLLREEVFVVGRTGAIPGEGAALATSEIVRLPLILPSRPNASRRLLDDWAAREGLWVEAKYEVDDHVITSALLKAGLGVSLMTRATIAADLMSGGEIDIRAIRPRAEWLLALVALEAPSRSAVLDGFIAMALAVVDEMKAAGAWPGRIADGD